MVSIRGATTVEHNNKEEIIRATKELLLRIENDNNLIKIMLLAFYSHQLKI